MLFLLLAGCSEPSPAPEDNLDGGIEKPDAIPSPAPLDASSPPKSPRNACHPTPLSSQAGEVLLASLGGHRKKDYRFSVGSWWFLSKHLDENRSSGTVAVEGTSTSRLPRWLHSIQEVYFLPPGPGGGYMITDPTHREMFEKGLRGAFATGKQSIAAILATHVHAVAAVFQQEGTFRVVDSMGGKAVDVDALAQGLNEACIVNKEGKAIYFQGDYVNTHIQKGGNECLFFATLYGTWMGYTGDLNMFEEVNGAFAAGSLQRYEDYPRVKGSKRIRDMSTYGSEIYRPFMRSWAYRAMGARVDRWEQLTVGELVAYPQNPQSFPFQFFVLWKDTSVPIQYEWMPDPGEEPWISRNAAGVQAPITSLSSPPFRLVPVTLDQTAGSLVQHASDGPCLLVFVENSRSTLKLACLSEERDIGLLRNGLFKVDIPAQGVRTRHGLPNP